MVAAADVIVAFKEFPHIDFAGAGRGAWPRLCLPAARRDRRRRRRRSTAGRVSRLHDQPRAGTRLRRSHQGHGGTRWHPEHLDRAWLLAAADVRDVGTKVLVSPTGAGGPEAGGRPRRASSGARSWDGGPATAPPTPHARRGHGECSAPAIARARDRSSSPTARTIPAAASPVTSTFMAAARARHPDIPAAIGALWIRWPSFCRAAAGGRRDPLRFGGKAAGDSGVPIDASVSVRATTADLACRSSRALSRSGPLRRSASAALDVVLASDPRPDLQPAGVHEFSASTLPRRRSWWSNRRTTSTPPLLRWRRPFSISIWAAPIGRSSPRSSSPRCADRSLRWIRIHGSDRHARVSHPRRSSAFALGSARRPRARSRPRRGCPSARTTSGSAMSGRRDGPPAAICRCPPPCSSATCSKRTAPG